MDTAVLLDYWFGDLAAADVDRVEEHLLECDVCGSILRDLSATAEGVRRLAHQGAVHVVVGPSFLETAARHGLRIREYRVPPGGQVACTVTAEDDLLISHLQGDFRGISRLDLAARIDGQPEHRILDLPVAPSAAEVILAQAMPAIRAMPSSTMRLRLLAREGEGEDGRERLVGEYTFVHTRAATRRD
jgi:hypothetical protein